jgi:hypothetical protein
MTEVVDQPRRGVAPSDHRPLHTLYAFDTPSAEPDSR